MTEPYWPCLCGGRAWSLDELVGLKSTALEEYPGEHRDYADMWRSFVGPFDFYCTEDDEVLLEIEAWRVRGLHVPVHDQDERDGAFHDLHLTWGVEG